LKAQDLIPLIDTAINLRPSDRHDVDAMAEMFFAEIRPEKMSFEGFADDFFEHLADRSRLENAIYTDLLEQLEDILNSLEEKEVEVSVNCWTEGNVFLQQCKAEVFHSKLPERYRGSIYVSLNKKQLLPEVFRDMSGRCDSLCLIDDRLANVLKAHQIAQKSNIPSLIIHKIRPDRPSTHQLNEQQKNSLINCHNWIDIGEQLKAIAQSRLALICDLDGVIYNTTVYRERLKLSLYDFLENILIRECLD